MIQQGSPGSPKCTWRFDYSDKCSSSAAAPGCETCRADTTVGGSLSVLIGLTPEFDSDCSHQCKQLATRIARLEVVVRRAGASIDLQPTETTTKEVEKTDSSMAALGQYWSDWTQSLTRAAQRSANSWPRGLHAWKLSFEAQVLRWTYSPRRRRRRPRSPTTAAWQLLVNTGRIGPRI